MNSFDQMSFFLLQSSQCPEKIEICPVLSKDWQGFRHFFLRYCYGVSRRTTRKSTILKATLYDVKHHVYLFCIYLIKYTKVRMNESCEEVSRLSIRSMGVRNNEDFKTCVKVIL